MKPRTLTFAVMLLSGCCIMPAKAGQIDSITYTDLNPTTTTINLTTAGTLDWVKWGNGETSGTSYATPVMLVGSGINPTLTGLGSPPQGTSVALIPFAPVPMVSPSFTWTNGTIAMNGGGPIGTVVSETILPAQNSYPIGLGASFTAEASAAPQVLDIYVQGFNARMNLSASLSGGGSGSLLASTAALIPVATIGGSNDFSFGVFAIEYSGAGETLTVNLTAANQSSIPTTAPQYQFANAGVFAATLTGAAVPEPSSLVLTAIGSVPLVGIWLKRRKKGSATVA